MTRVLTDVTEADRVGTRPAWLTSAVFPFQSRFLELDAVRIHYVDEGGSENAGGGCSRACPELRASRKDASTLP